MKRFIFCCGLRSIWCVIDTIHHKLPGEGTHWRWEWICDKHDEAITGEKLT